MSKNEDLKRIKERIKELEFLINYHKKKYHEEDNPEIEDWEYDKLKHERVSNKLSKIRYEIKTINTNTSYICFDLETTGLSAANNKIIEIGAVRIVNGKIEDEFCTLVNPGIKIPRKIIKITGINNEMISDAPCELEAIQKFINFCKNSAVLVAHNATFDVSFLVSALKRYNLNFNFKYIDTLTLCRNKIKFIKDHKLSTIAKYFKLPKFNYHRANDDAKTLAMIFLKLLSP